MKVLAYLVVTSFVVLTGCAGKSIGERHPADDQIESVIQKYSKLDQNGNRTLPYEAALLIAAIAFNPVANAKLLCKSDATGTCPKVEDLELEGTDSMTLDRIGKYCHNHGFDVAVFSSEIKDGMTFRAAAEQIRDIAPVRHY